MFRQVQVQNFDGDREKKKRKSKRKKSLLSNRVKCLNFSTENHEKKIIYFEIGLESSKAKFIISELLSIILMKKKNLFCFFMFFFLVKKKPRYAIFRDWISGSHWKFFTKKNFWSKYIKKYLGFINSKKVKVFFFLLIPWIPLNFSGFFFVETQFWVPKDFFLFFFF